LKQRLALDSDIDGWIDGARHAMAAHHHLVPGVGVDEGVDHGLPHLEEDEGHIDHQRLAQPLRVVVLRENEGCHRYIRQSGTVKLSDRRRRCLMVCKQASN